MKIIYKCAECGELLTVAAGEVKGNGDALFYVKPHECFPETEAATREPSGRPWDAWPPPAQEMTPGGLDGTVLNTCMLCGAEATHTGRDRFGYDSFKCSSEYCGAEFEQTGLGPELLPCCFGEGAKYRTKLGNGKSLEFCVFFSGGDDTAAEICTTAGSMLVDIVKDGDSEFFVAPPSVGGQGEIVYPYCKVP